MANITDKVANIRQSVYGKDVRESLASGIESINSEVVSVNERQLVVDQNESDRISEETARITAENDRKINEPIRVSAENVRINNESYRVIAENTRLNSETVRLTAENLRINNEPIRVSAENIRKTNETARITAENIRINNETGRVTNESNRVIREDVRISNETIRVANETARQNSFNAMTHTDATLEIIEARGDKEFLKDRFIDIETDINNIDITIEKIEHNTSQLSEKATYYNSVLEMKTDTNIKVGTLCKTSGYYLEGDMGNGLYKIVDDNTLIDDGGSIHTLANGLKAVLILENGTINIRQFGTGIKTIIVEDTSDRIQKCFDYVKALIDVAGKISDANNLVIEFPNYTKVKTPIKIFKNCNIRGISEKSIITTHSAFSGDGVFILEDDTDAYKVTDVMISNINIIFENVGLSFDGIHFDNDAIIDRRIHLKNIKVKSATNWGIYMNIGGDNKLINCDTFNCINGVYLNAYDTTAENIIVGGSQVVGRCLTGFYCGVGPNRISNLKVYWYAVGIKIIGTSSSVPRHSLNNIHLQDIFECGLYGELLQGTIIEGLMIDSVGKTNYVTTLNNYTYHAIHFVSCKNNILNVIYSNRQNDNQYTKAPTKYTCLLYLDTNSSQNIINFNTAQNYRTTDIINVSSNNINAYFNEKYIPINNLRLGNYESDYFGIMFERTIEASTPYIGMKNYSATNVDSGYTVLFGTSKTKIRNKLLILSEDGLTYYQLKIAANGTISTVPLS